MFVQKIRQDSSNDKLEEKEKGFRLLHQMIHVIDKYILIIFCSIREMFVYNVSKSKMWYFIMNVFVHELHSEIYRRGNEANHYSSNDGNSE